ncbi:MAG: polyprenyl diphosphate synthase [Candidatus Bathyarchaeota archaeon]|nr:polyprenyl diphosphate synthase [Candidatus Bathyarchaeota archaeon]MDH5531935.1 polyprenyl diphosphate synthase [Candidatus Bathyarchaeota archaeon]MDH5712500.1 polyprenyl diphosphate synthase [Candidatus Bathyarchaeota archaeon]
MLKSLLSLLGVYKAYEKWLWYQVKGGLKPDHIAIILDGNRRWASERLLNPWVGHHHGADKIQDLLKWCLDLGVKSITLYAFSTENFQRTQGEVSEIMKIVEEKLHEILEEEQIHRHKVRVKVIGRLSLLPNSVQEIVKKVEEATKDYDAHFLNVALAYGGRAEIVDATKKIAKKVEKGKLNPEGINERVFESHLYTAYMPKQDPDLVVRTSGEERLSGFLLWQCAYSELCFLDVYWPEFRRIDLLRAVRTYQRRKRRFGA